METLSRTRPHHLSVALPKSLSQRLISKEASSSFHQLLGPQERLRALAGKRVDLGEV